MTERYLFRQQKWKESIEMENQIFRKKSMDKISSPEQLNDYVRVSNPGIWMILFAVIILLVGVCVWGIFGHLDTEIKVAGICKKEILTCYVKEADIESVKEGMTVTVDKKQYEVAGISTEPVSVTDEMESYVLHLGELQKGEWVYPVMVKTELEDGTYQAKITVESVSPMSFITN